MKINIDTKKGTEAVAGFLQKTTDISKKTLADLQAGATALSEKTKQENYQRRLKKYNPIFPDVFHSEEFNLPNMIMIRDDAERRDIDVCEGAIGWLGKEKGMEVLYLYDEAVSTSGIRFIPSATCDSIYYVDSFDRSRFVRVDCIFSKAHEEKLAELKHIAHSLGAKCCSIEINESNVEVDASQRKSSFGEKAKLKGVSESGSESTEKNSSSKNFNQLSGRVTVRFEGSAEPKRPILKWFANDDNVNKLIEMRCNGDNSINSETLEISGASSATMSLKTASAIDSSIGGMGFRGSSTMEMQVKRESCSTLIFNIEF